MRPPAWSLLLLLLLAASCREAEKAPGGSSLPASASDEVSPATTVSVSCDESRGGRRTGLLLTDVRLGTHQGYDRIVFEFKPAILPAGPGGTGTSTAPTGLDVGPRYEVSPATPPFARDPSDEPFAVAGDFFLRVVVHGATGVDLSSDEPAITYRGPKELRPDHPILKEAEQESDHHGAMVWILGVDTERCWRVLELEDPPRLVVDIVREGA